MISVMLAVADAPAAAVWYRQALGATELWNLGSVIGLDLDGAVFLIGEPESNGWNTPDALGMPSARVELFCDDSDAVFARAVAAGAQPTEPPRNHNMPGGTHRQGVFMDPFGHLWFVGDTSPLTRSL